ncbi:uncharacterized protein F4817DRAFT_354182 [Daldinia loculata]|uniref:uncharacterized protein n=1 Tax=Daldinia loculata TaxID=103429 RepID=UPI0020C4E6EC|nr:uncharacterized protein F4817DRAFT_354182 [Daldinia loculata]KAI1642005.1 hypothetical protein F4817DRAFT_354182 [Daldinia loculata]
MHLKDAPRTRLPGPEVLWNKVFNRVKDNGMVRFPDPEIRAGRKHKLPEIEKLYLLPRVSCLILGRDEDSDIRVQIYLGKTRMETVYPIQMMHYTPVVHTNIPSIPPT